MKRWMGLIAAAFLMAGLLAATGCLRSHVLVTSDPPGAEVIWHGQPYGATPVDIPFIWYWYYDYSVEKPGYEKIDMTERFRTPPWFLPPLDLIMEVAPLPISDTRRRHFVLKPSPAPGSELTEIAAGPPAAETGTMPSADAAPAPSSESAPAVDAAPAAK